MDFNFPDFLVNETVQNDNLNSADLMQNYLLLKKKICETHEVIKQYNDKLKECDRLKSDLDSATKQTKKVTCGYNSALAKVIKLEMQNTEYKKNIDTLTTQVNDHKIKSAADQQYIQQLICKIKDVENQNNDKLMQYDLKKSSFEMKIKELEAELKTTKKTYETKIKKMEKKSSAENNECHSSIDIITKDVATNTSNNSNNIISKNVATNTSSNSNNIITKNVATNTSSNSNNIITKNVATNTCSNSNNIITENVATNTASNSNNVITKNVATNTCNNQTRNVGTITTFTKDEIMKQSQVSEKCVLTDEFYRVSDDMYPIFCAKCEVHIDPTPFDKICKVMTESCPKLIEKISSPLKKPAPVRPDVTSGYRKAENLIALSETPPPHFHTEIARSAFVSPDLSAPTPLDHLDYCHNFSQPLSLSNKSDFCVRSTSIPVPLVNTTTASQTDHCTGKTIDALSQSIISSLEDRVDTLAKKLRKKMKKLKSQKSSNCCMNNHPNPSRMFDMNSTMQFNFMELWRRMIDMYQPNEKKPVVVHKSRDTALKMSKLSRRKPTKRLRSAYSGNSWEVAPVSKKAEKSSPRKRPKKRKYRHSMLLKKSDVSVENSEHLASDSDSNSYDNLFDTNLTNEDVSNEPNNLSYEETMNEACDDVIEPLIHSSAHLTDVDEPEIVDRVKNSVECSKSTNGETDSGIHSDSIESSKLVQYEPDLDSCFLSKTCGNTRDMVTVKSTSSFAGNFKLNRTRSTEKSTTIEGDKPNLVLPSFLQEEPETPKTSEEPEISESTSTNVTVTRKRKFGELQEPKHRLDLMRKLRNLKTKKIQTFPKLYVTEEVAYCEHQKEDKNKEEEKTELEHEAETVEEDYVPKKKARVAHISKAAKEENISLNSCAQARTALLKNVEDENVESQITIADITEPDTSIAEETNMTQETPIQTTAKEDSEKLADKSSSETMEDISPLSPDPNSSNEMSGNDRGEQPKIIPVESAFDNSALIEQSEQSRNGFEINMSVCKKSVTETDNATNDIFALEQSEQGKEGLEINLPMRNEPVIDTDNTTKDNSTLTKQSEQTRKGLEINLSAPKKSVTETNNTINDISALIVQPEQRRKRPEINMPAYKKPVIETDNTTKDISTLTKQSEQTRKGLEINLSAPKNLVTETHSTINAISALIVQPEQRRKRLEINMSAYKKRVIETDNTTKDIFTLTKQSEQTRKGLEINLSTPKKSVTETHNTINAISALIVQPEQRRKRLEINMPAYKKPVIETDNTTKDISTLTKQSEQTRKGLEINLSAPKKSVTETDNTINDISALIVQPEQRRKRLEINMPAYKKPVIETGNSTNNISALIEQSEQTTKELEINFPACKRPLETDHIKNESNDELRIDGSNQPKEWTIANIKLNECLKSLSCEDNDSLVMVEEVVENNKPFDSKGPRTLREYRANEMNYYRDMKLNSYAPVLILERLKDDNIFKNIHHRRKLDRFEHIRATTDMFVTKELQRLINSEWESDVHQDVCGKLKTGCTPRIIAKNIVDFLSTEEECKQSLDKTHTPPAPLMTKSQQRITALLVDLEKEFPMIIELVQSGIEYKIFKFNQKLYKYVVESLARMYTVLARVQKDRERVRIFCCDALYCLGLNATIVLYTVFTSWPEVLPSNDITKEYLPKCIAHLILSMTAVDYPKLSALKSLVRIYYKYPLGTLSKDMIIDLLKAFQEKCQGEVMAAIALLAKKEGTAWTYKNIVKAVLLPMIVNNKCFSQYKAFCLLGTLLRPFPIEDEDKAVSSIVEQLSDLCDSDAVSDEQQEGVMSALMSLSRHKFNVVLPHLLKWTPNLPLRDRTVDQIYGLYNLREPNYWAKCISSYKQKRT